MADVVSSSPRGGSAEPSTVRRSTCWRSAGRGLRTCWIIGRQHPGETMAEWWMEGFLERLLDPADPLARALLEKASGSSWCPI